MFQSLQQLHLMPSQCRCVSMCNGCNTLQGFINSSGHGTTHDVGRFEVGFWFTQFRAYKLSVICNCIRSYVLLCERPSKPAVRSWFFPQELVCEHQRVHELHRQDEFGISKTIREVISWKRARHVIGSLQQFSLKDQSDDPPEASGLSLHFD